MKLNSAVTVVDAKKAKMYIKNFGEFFLNQIENAGTILLTRTDKAPQEKIEEVAAEAAKISIADTPISFEYGICTLSKEEFDFEEGLRLSDVELLKKKDEYHGRA